MSIIIGMMDKKAENKQRNVQHRKRKQSVQRRNVPEMGLKEIIG
jgi:hypothetical protein